MSYRIIAAALLATLGCGSANAACLYKPFQVQPEKNGGIVVNSVVEAGTFCAHDFAAAPGYKFESVTIDRPPGHGALTQTEATSFVFTPSRKFSGKDAYIIKICASKGEQRGCSTIAFIATVRGKRDASASSARERAGAPTSFGEKKISLSD